MKITISGTPGSGKSTIAKGISKELGYEHFSMGDFQRELAKERGLTIREWGELEKADPKYDRMVDDKQTDLSKKKDNFVLDSRLGAKFIPDAIKIFVDAVEDIRIERRLSHKRKEEDFESHDEARFDMRKREEANRERFLKFYGFDFLDMSNYDIIIDTSALNIKTSIAKTLEEIGKIEKFFQK